MRFRTIVMLLAFALLSSAAARAQEQQKDQQVIDDFVTTRGVTFEEPGKKSQKQSVRPSSPRRSGSASAGKAAGSKGNTVAKSGAGAGTPSVDDSKVAAQVKGTSDAGTQTLKASAGVGAAPRAIALGYTILQKDDAGRLSVADPARTFKTGDRIAVALETNADGYLYMFNASDGKNPELLFPSPLLDGGTNAIQAHARATFPADPSLDFKFTDPPAAEHLFVVFSRQPLAGVPVGEELVRFCGTNVDDCAWKPTPAQWERIRGAARLRGIVEAKNAQLAQATLPVMPDTLARGIKVKRDDAAPAIVRVNNTPNADILVTEIVLTHK